MSVENKSSFAFNITYHQVFSKLFEIYLLLTPDREHWKFFKKVSITGFRRAKGLEAFLVRANVATLEKKKDCCRLCGSAR